MLVNLKDMREFEDESTSFVLFETEAASEEVEAGDLDDLVRLGENEVLEFEDLAGLLLNLHVIVVAMVSDSFLLLGYGGGLGHGSCGSEIQEDECDGFQSFGFGFEEIGRIS